MRVWVVHDAAVNIVSIGVPAADIAHPPQLLPRPGFMTAVVDLPDAEVSGDEAEFVKRLQSLRQQSRIDIRGGHPLLVAKATEPRSSGDRS